MFSREVNVLKDRIKKVRTQNTLTMEQFGNRIGITKSSVSLLESGKNSPSEQTIKLICREFGVSYIWLTEGIEPMYESMDIDSMTKIDNIMTGENEFAKNLFKEFAKLDESEWKLLEKIIKNLFENQK